MTAAISPRFVAALPTAAAPSYKPSLPVAGANVGGTLAGGGFGNFKSLFKYGAAGAMLGAIFPVIPGGPIGGALIGVLLSLF